MFFSEVTSDILNSFLKVSSEVPLAHHQGLILKEVGETSILGINVLDSFVNTVLSNKLSRELEVIGGLSLERDCVMHVVNIFLSPLTEVTHKSVEVMALRHIHSTVTVEVTHLVHEHEGHVFVVNVKNEVGSLLEDVFG